MLLMTVIGGLAYSAFKTGISPVRANRAVAVATASLPKAVEMIGQAKGMHELVLNERLHWRAIRIAESTSTLNVKRGSMV